jgi:anti-sigma regulatory factor (Ser/Thr protein kinase)
MIDSGIFAMNSIFNDVCVLVTIAFALTLAPGFNRAGLSFLSRRDQATALVENAVQHGLRSSPQAGRLCLVVRPAGPWLELSVSDDGKGVPSTEVGRFVVFEMEPNWLIEGLIKANSMISAA